MAVMKRFENRESTLLGFWLVVLATSWMVNMYVDGATAITSIDQWHMDQSKISPLRCNFTLDSTQAVKAGQLGSSDVAFHKTLFRCPSTANCPAEKFYFNDGWIKLDCHDPFRKEGKMWCNGSLSGCKRGDLQDDGTCLDGSVLSNVCLDAANWTDITGNTCDSYAATYCNQTYLEFNNRTAWNSREIQDFFLDEQGNDMRSFVSATGSLSPLDACCACGGGGSQKEALQQCKNVLVESVASDENEDEETLVSWIVTNPAEKDRAGQEGPLCAGCKQDWILQKDGTCLKCEDQSTGASIFVYGFVALCVFFARLRALRTYYRTDAVDLALRNLKTSEDSQGTPLFDHLGNAKGGMLLDIMLQQMKQELSEEGAGADDDSNVNDDEDLEATKALEAEKKREKK